MSKKDEALKLALVAERVLKAWDDPQGMPALCEEMNCLREALAEQPAQQQEPVAWIRWEWNRTGRKSLVFEKPVELPLSEEATGVVYDPLYPSPQPSKPWVGLDDADMDVCDTDGRLMARYWERVLREKNA